MKPNNGWKPLVVIQCYEDRQQTLALRKSVAPVADSNTAAAASDAVTATRTCGASIQAPPPPPPPMHDNCKNISSEIINGPLQSKGVNAVKVNSLTGISTVRSGNNMKSSLNGTFNNNKAAVNGKDLNGTVNGKAFCGAVTDKGLNLGFNMAVNGILDTNETVDVESNENERPYKKSNRNATLKRIPTPDYETTNIELLTAKLKLKSQNEKAEVDSIKSYITKNAASPQSKPTSNYFMRPLNGTATTKKTGRPVSITIGEYPTRTLRKEPSKLAFLNGEDKATVETDIHDPVPVGSRLQSELAMTLSRSNLRTKTELLAQFESNGKIAVDNSDDSDQAPDKNFHKRYGNNIMPTPPQISIPKVPVVKTNSHPISQHIALLAGKVVANQLEVSPDEAKQ